MFKRTGGASRRRRREERDRVAEAERKAKLTAYEGATQKEAIEAGLSDSGFLDFDGNNCDPSYGLGPCLGWDGESHRCDCGNRRVYWETEFDNDTGKWHARAVAY